MPFIKKADREKMKIIPEYVWADNDNTPNIAVGDRCYHFYKIMVEKWKKHPRWTTAHFIYRDLKKDIKENKYSEDTITAYELAWQVFFLLYVMPYEKVKQRENGNI